MPALEKQKEEDEVPQLAVKEEFFFPSDHECIRLNIEWIGKTAGLICDLDLNILCYDERARLCEKIDSSNKTSKDASCLLIKESDTAGEGTAHQEYLKLDFRIAQPSTTAIVLYLDGGPRNFQFLQSVSVQCTRVFPDRSVYSDFLPSEGNSNGKSGPLFRVSGRTRKNYQGLVLGVLYKDGWHVPDSSADASNGGSSGSGGGGLASGVATPRWVMKPIMEPLYMTSSREKQERCDLVVVNAVPALEKYRPRLFSSIREICAALSSHSLPKLKKKFQKGEGLAIGQFTEVLFKQLYETHPKIVEESEAAYAVAMLQEMFHQIDYNGDGNCNWDEFTTFCVQTGLLNTMSGGGGGGGAAAAGGGGGGAGQKASQKPFSLDQYVIEYGEELLQRDRVLSAYRFVSLMRYVPETRKICVISEDSDNVTIFDERFRVHSQLYPSKVQVVGAIVAKDAGAGAPAGARANGFPRVVIYDIIYLTGREMYCYTSSDHCITVCKEFSSMGGKKVNYQQYNRFYHTLLHLKLCWSAKHELLCSVASDKVIYGWNIDTAQVVFQVARHSDIITDFLAVDPLNIFITCSMDRRIVLWSATSRRVKGVLLGHKRGVRCLSVYDNTLLSAGFEVDAKTWDLTSRDCVAVLKGHRHPVAAAKLMCDRAPSEKEHRAITVDESGEFRLWNIYVRERSSDPVQVPTLQIFEMQHPETPVNQFRFLALPFNPNCSTSYYSDLVACSTKLLHFVPEKNTKEFVPPQACLFNESTATVMTAFGKSIIVYDVSTGNYSTVFEDLSRSEISAMCLDGIRGRKMYVGTSAGEVLLVNSTTGSVLDQVEFHTKEVTSLCQRTGIRNCVYSASMDGHIRLYDESNGKLHLHNSLENAFGEGVGITRVKSAPSVNVLVATSTGNTWGIFHDTSMKKLLIVHQQEVVTAFEIVGASRDKAQQDYLQRSNTGNSKFGSGKFKQSSTFAMDKENLLTLVLCMASGLVVYTVSAEDMRGVKTFELLHDHSAAATALYINELSVLQSPDVHSVNYSSMRSSADAVGLQLLAVSDDGQLIVWDTHDMRFQSDQLYRQHYKGVPRRLSKLNQQRMQQETEAATLALNATSMLTGSGGPSIRGLGQGRGKANGAKGANRLKAAVHNALSSMAAGTGVSQDGGGAGSLISDAASVASFNSDSVSASGGPGPGIPARSGTGGRSRAQKQQQTATAAAAAGTEYAWAELDSEDTFPLPAGLPRPKFLKATQSWQGHLDTIPQVVPLHTHGCVLTVSHDGYHRMWNIDAQLLGEMVLPNITEAMKGTSRCTEPGTKWRFILERIPITKHHVELSVLMVKNILQTGKAQLNSGPDRRHLNVPIGFKGFRDSGLLGGDSEEVVVDDEQSMLRKTMLRSLTETPLPSTELPPTRLPTKEEKELIKLSLSFASEAGAGGVREPSMASLVIGEQSTTTAPPGMAMGTGTGTGNIDRRSASPNAGSMGLGSSSRLGTAGSSGVSSRTRTGGGSRGHSRGSKLQPLATSPSCAAGDSFQPTASNTSPVGIRTGSRGGRSSRAASPQRGQALRSSAFFGGDSSVLMSAFGGESLWAVPGERDIFGHLTMTLHNDAPDSSVPPAFSEQSINAMRRAGLIDIEGHQILRRVAASSDRVQVYDRSQPTLLVRSPALSTSVTLPALDSMRLTEISFGAQKDMYRNAERVLKDRDNISRTTVRNAVAKSRIDQNVRKVGSMIHLIQPPSHDEVILPKGASTGKGVGGAGDGNMHGDGEEMQKLRSEDQRMKIRLLKSAAMVPVDAAMNARPLDRRSIDRWMSRMHAAVEPYQEGGRHGAGGGQGHGRESPQRRKKRESLSQAAIHALEKKLQQAIRADYRARVQRQQRPGLAAPGQPPGQGQRQGQGQAADGKGEEVGSATEGVESSGHQEQDSQGDGDEDLLGQGEDDEEGDDKAAGLEASPVLQALDALSSPASPSPASPSPAAPAAPAAAPTSSPKTPLAHKRSPTQQPAAAPAATATSTTPAAAVGGKPAGSKSGAGGGKGGLVLDANGKMVLTTRQLLPYYKLESVHQFMDIFAKVDENFSGDLDVNEWIRLFTSLNESVPVLEARMIFMKIDKDNDGYLTMRELVPVVFNKATREQQRLIVQYAELELTKKIENESIPKVTTTDLEFLFEAYDTENIGFVDVSVIKERVRNMYLSEQALFHFMEGIADMADDEMVNISEFKRLFKRYTSTTNRS